MSLAVVIDGAYFIRRFTQTFPNLDRYNPGHLAFGVAAIADWHLAERLTSLQSNRAMGKKAVFAGTNGIVDDAELYRIFFYDCAPLTKLMHRPVSKQSVNWGKTPEASLRVALHDNLLGTRKVALRLGRLNEKFASWKPKPNAIERWLKNPDAFHPVDDDFELDVTQKGVDMRFGLDIASMAYKKQINQLVMIANDADFVPPAKLARREGIDVILDPMHGNVARDLKEHVDGIRSCSIDINPTALLVD
jgi:uncharacterized LabA/DUF88 family protein